LMQVYSVSGELTLMKKKKKIHKVDLNAFIAEQTRSIDLGGGAEKIGTKRLNSRRMGSSREALQLVDVFITMDSGGVFIFAFASEEDEEEEAAEKEETK